MKIVSINTVFFGSTGRIMLRINELAERNGHETLAVSGYALGGKNAPENAVVIGGFISKAIHKTLAKLTGLQGCFSYFATKKAISKIKKFEPNVIHLHNLHAWFINLPLLFKYIKKNEIRVVWTLHNCWSFTGHCPHFEYAGCEKWKGGCKGCTQYKEYPSAFVDKAAKMYCLKKKWFTDIKDLTIVTPSEWLADKVRQSFLGEHPIKVINNGIDLGVFGPAESNFREKYNISSDKKILLGVAFGWGVKKGLDVFCELSERLDREKYQIVLVGTDDNTDKLLPSGIISIHRTQNQKELAEIYTAADVFVNPTREDTFPTVNMEALACGTPVVTFNTGGSSEIINETCGAVTSEKNAESMEREIVRICKEQPFSKDACIKRAEAFDMNDRFSEYIELYEELSGEQI